METKYKIPSLIVKERRRKLHIVEIETTQGDTITSTQNIGEDAMKVFKGQFMKINYTQNYEMLESISKVIIEAHNEMLTNMPI